MKNIVVPSLKYMHFTTKTIHPCFNDKPLGIIDNSLIHSIDLKFLLYKHHSLLQSLIIMPSYRAI